MSEMGFENVFYLENFECGDEVLVESSPPASPVMAARLAAPAQGSAGAGGGSSPGTVRELIVIPELPNAIHLQHAIQQVSSTVVEVNGDSSGHSSPAAEAHTYITVAMQGAWRGSSLPIKEELSDQESEGGNGVNYHVQYVEPQEIYTQGHQPQINNVKPQTASVIEWLDHRSDSHSDSQSPGETLRTYPVYGVTTVASAAADAAPDNGWAGGATAEYTTYGVVVAGDEAEAPASPATPAGGPPPRMPPATVQWLLDHYENAEGVSLPRSTLYTHYIRHCTTHRLDPVNAASFGKLIRSVFVGLRTRRLGTRGNSKYHYYGIRAKASAGDAPPALDTVDEKTELADQQEMPEREQEREAACSPAGLAGIGHRQYLGACGAPEPPALDLQPPPDVTAAALDALRDHHRSHGAELLEAVAALDTAAVERARRAFWRRLPVGGVRRLLARRDAAAWLRDADLRLYQQAVELLLPDVLRPIPPQLTQAIRNFAKSLEAALAAGAAGAPAAAARAQASAAAALAAALRRYTSLNHLAQAARAVLANQHQIQQMLSDLNRVDFRVVREQAAWACSCGGAATAHRLEADFKATLGRGATLEQWAAWLEGCVRGALAAHERRPDYTARARRLLLDWSFYSSLVIRELTLRSAASFGSFHLIRLLYDEYVSYLIERRVAAHHQAPPISVMTRPADEEEEDLPEEAPREDLDEEQEWDWEDEDEEDDEPTDAKKLKVNEL